MREATFLYTLLAIITFGLLMLNLVRIITLYYVGVFAPSAFDVMHEEVWQAVFIILPLVAWVGWVRRTSGKKGSSGHASTT